MGAAPDDRPGEGTEKSWDDRSKGRRQRISGLEKETEGIPQSI